MMHDMRDLQCLNVGITPGCYSEGLRREFPGHLRAPRELLGPQRLPLEAGRVSSRFHPALLKEMHRVAPRR